MKFNHLSFFCFLLILPLLGISPLRLKAQQGITYRDIAPPQRTNSGTTTLPCAGSEIFSEDFENGFPVGWTVIDGDNLDPRTETGLVKGWQILADYIDSTDQVMVTPSWYDPVGQSDDWLITPPITLGGNSCLSWEARSQDQFFKDAYEVRISTTTADTNAFLSNAPLVEVAGELGSNNTRTVNLSAYANQTVYLAFRQVSDDKFVLVLDDIKVSNVNDIDIGVVGFEYGAPQPGDTVYFEAEIGNFGSDTITSFNLIYSVAGNSPRSHTVSSVILAPNATIFVDHEDYFIADSSDSFYFTCFWTSLPNATTDEDFSNDSLCINMPVGSPVGRPEPQLEEGRIVVYPNPFGNQLQLKVEDLPGKMDAEIRLFDLLGREQLFLQRSLRNNMELNLETASLPSGMYLLQITSGDRVLFVRRLLRE
jgi:hypothetical protein